MNATNPDPDGITIMAPDGTVRVVAIGTAELTVGRKPDNNIVLDYPDVSPLHARIQFDGTDYRVIDLNSTNGTFLGNVRLLPGVPQVWAPEKAVRIGESWLRLERRLGARPPAQAESAPAPGAESTGTAPRVAAFVEVPDLAVDPGAAAVLTITVLNQGPVVDHLQVSVLNLPADWLPGPMPVIRLLPGARQPVTVTIAPPRRPESRAGIYPFTVRVSSQEAPGQFADVQAQLTVHPYARFQGELRPQAVRTGKPAQARIENQGNAPETYTVSLRDRGEELVFEPQQQQITVGAGEAGTAEFRTRARKRSLIGGEKRHSFVAEVASSGGEKQPLAGEAISRGLIPPWLPPVLLVLILGAAGVLLALLMQGRQPPAINSLTVDPPAPVAGQPVTVRWSVKGAESIELRPLVAGIDPAAGQYTFAGGLPAGASLTFVAQNQYGSTERALALTVQSPTPTPTPEPGAPIIREWSVSPLTVVRGQAVTIRWAVENAESVTVQPIGTVELSGQVQERPGTTTRYTLIATNKGKTAQRSFEVIVEEPTPTRQATPTPTIGLQAITVVGPFPKTAIVPLRTPTPTPTPTLLFRIITPGFKIPTTSP